MYIDVIEKDIQHIEPFKLCLYILYGREIPIIKNSF